ncbi:G2/mitotic-specific cyclin-B3-like [Bolinopsis microptera]|uniref:G2/mitotic-specific cyclin-B3-like n=1 Tax=Bolinopsis microptera TaxID=2820187 RepID=UPI00307904BB
MPLTRSTSRAAAVVATKIPMPTNSRKRSIISPGPHKQCTKRSALGDITNQVLLEDPIDQIKGGKVGPKKPPKPAFTIFEENVEPENKKAKKSEPKSTRRSKDLVVQNPVIALTRSQKSRSLESAEPKPEWRDIDADTTDPMFAPEYAAEIFENLREREVHFLVEDYLSNQAEITETMRAILIDWLVEVQETFELFHETLYLAVRMVDRYLNRKNVRKLHLQLLGVTAIFLASKMEERYPPPLEDFIFVCDRAYTEDQILKMERVLCAELEYEVYMPLSYSFLRRYGKCVNADMRLLTIGRYALELSLQEYQYVTYRPSQLAAAALLFAMRKSGNTDWDITCQHYSSYTEEDLNELISMMDKSTVAASSNKHCKTIYKKYSHRVFFEVALLPPLQ